MTIEADRERLTQSKLLARLSQSIPMTEMVTLYLSDQDEDHNHGIYCALIPTAQIEQSLSNPTWDLSEGQGMPGAVKHGFEDEAEVSYLRFGNMDGVEPLLFCRGFHGIRDACLEISEEFRHFHNLCHDRKQDRFIKIDDSGDEYVVAIIEANQVQVRLKEVRQFLAVKEMHLVIQFDCREYSSHTLAELGAEAGGSDTRDGLLCYGLNYGDLGGTGNNRTFSRFLGKRLIHPVAKEKSGLWGYGKEEPKKYVDFIIGVDDNGDEIASNSSPGQLANNFGGNPDAPHYLTAVQFQKEVLDKYYQQPQKYSVASGILRCGGLWCMYIDNHFDDRVAAWLGDLGRDLPYEEQLHWRSYNIPPIGGVSKIYFARQLMCIATDSDRPEHEFRRVYDKVMSVCRAALGWHILLPLCDEDAHCLQAIRVPARDEQKDFDDLVLALTKLLVDSLNEKKLDNLIPTVSKGKIKGSISRLERALQACGVEGFEDHIQFLRNVQRLRSAGTAHRKGKNYHKIAQEFRVDSQSLRIVFQGILVKAIQFLECIEAAVQSGRLGSHQVRTEVDA